MTTTETVSAPKPLPNQRTFDGQPLPPTCRSADFDKAQKVRRRTVKALQDVDRKLAAWVGQCIAFEFQDEE